MPGGDELKVRGPRKAKVDAALVGTDSGASGLRKGKAGSVGSDSGEGEV